MTDFRHRLVLPRLGQLRPAPASPKPPEISDVAALIIHAGKIRRGEKPDVAARPQEPGSLVLGAIRARGGETKW